MDWDTLVATLLVVLLFAIHLASRKLEHIGEEKRSFVMSVAGGVSAAYVFLHLLPELRQHESLVVQAVPALTDEVGIYLLALLGLMVFFGLERLVVRSEERTREKEVGPVLFWTHIGAFAVNSFIIGHLIVVRDDNTAYMVLFAIALALHFVTNDHALRLRHEKLHQRHGRWILAAAVVLGWAAGVSDLLPDAVAAALLAVLAGGIVFNVMKDELPPHKGGSFTAFAIGAASYAALLAIMAGS
jgi:hypothetical protein